MDENVATKRSRTCTSEHESAGKTGGSAERGKAPASGATARGKAPASGSAARGKAPVAGASRPGGAPRPDSGAPRPGGAEPDRIAYLSHATARTALFCLADSRPGVERLPDRTTLLSLSAPAVSTQGQAKALAASGALDFLGPDARPYDLIVPTAQCRSRGRVANLHVWRDLVQPGSFWRANERVLVSSPGFVVLQLACARRPTALSRELAARAAQQERRVREQLGLPVHSFTDKDLLDWANISHLVGAVVAACEFASTYRPPHPGSAGTTFDRPPLASLEEVGELLGRLPASSGIMRARRAVGLAFDGSASPMETALALILTLPLDMGGFGLLRPRLNQEIHLPEGFLGLPGARCVRPDLCWERERVALEYDGDPFHPAASPEVVSADNERQNSLTALGYRVLRVRFPQVASLRRVTLLARQLASLLGVPLEDADDLQLIRRQKLILKLTGPQGG